MMEVFPLFRFRNLIARVTFRVFIAPFMRACGSRTVVVRPSGIEGIRNISLGRDIFVGEGAVLAAVSLTGSPCPELVIGSRCSLGRNNHIYATRKVVLEENVLTAGGVYISDNTHRADDPNMPVRDQPVRQLGEVRIGAGSWLGQNVCVIGASIGRGCVIGANSVVLSNVPDHCLAVGAPARVVRRYCHTAKSWMEFTAPISDTALRSQREIGVE